MSVGRIPYSWEVMEQQIRRAICAQASILWMFGPGEDVARAFVGTDEVDLFDLDSVTEEDLARVPIERHALYRHVRMAYLYAYQIDGYEEATEELWYETAGLLAGYPQADFLGETSPLCNDFPLRRMLETFFARWHWAELGGDLSVRALSLLANMTMPAVRTSLSKEGFILQQRYKTTSDDSDRDGVGVLPAEDALVWLSRRRGFIPNRRSGAALDPLQAAAAVLADDTLPFAEMLRRIVTLAGARPADLARASGRSEEWMTSLLQGVRVEIDLGALCALAARLGVSVPDFVARAVRHLLASEAEVAGGR